MLTFYRRLSRNTNGPSSSVWVDWSKAALAVPASSSSIPASTRTAKSTCVPSRSTCHLKRFVFCLKKKRSFFFINCSLVSLRTGFCWATLEMFDPSIGTMKDVIRIFLRNSNIEMKSNLTIADFDPRFGDGVRRRCRLLPRPQSDHGRHQRGELQVGPFFFKPAVLRHFQRTDRPALIQRDMMWNAILFFSRQVCRSSRRIDDNVNVEWRQNSRQLFSSHPQAIDSFFL